MSRHGCVGEINSIDALNNLLKNKVSLMMPITSAYTYMV